MRVYRVWYIKVFLINKNIAEQTFLCIELQYFYCETPRYCNDSISDTCLFVLPTFVRGMLYKLSMKSIIRGCHRGMTLHEINELIC